MRRNALLSLRGPLAVLALLVLPLTACFEPTSVICASGLVCPAGQQCAARQEVCIKTSCGDGIVQEGEACDDGNILDGDGCSRDCKSNETCGNRVVDLVEHSIVGAWQNQLAETLPATTKNEVTA